MRPHSAVLVLLLISFPLTTHAVTLGSEVELATRATDAGDGATSHRAIAPWNDRFYVVWSAPRALMLSVFDNDGRRVDERALLGNIEPLESVIVNDGSRLLVLWSDAVSTRISVLSEGGTLSPSDGVVLGSRGSGLDIAVSANAVLAIWRNGSTLTGTILDQSLQKVASLSDGSFPANAIRAASDGGTFLLTWSGTPDTPGLFARVVRPDASLGTPIVVDSDPQYSAPSIVWNGTQYLIASGTEDGLRMSLVDRDGEPAGTSVLTWPQEHVTHTALASHPFGFLVTAAHWIQPGGTPEVPQPTHLHSFLVSRAGARYSDPAAVSTVGTTNTIPALVSNGLEYFVTWNYSASGSDRSARGTIIHSNGDVLFTDESIPGVTVSHGLRSQRDAQVAHGRGLFLAVWADGVRERNASSVRIARLDQDGRSLDGAGVELYRSEHDPRPSFACGRTRCLAAYQSLDDQQRHSVMGSWISLDGRSISPPFTIVAELSNDYSGVLTSDGENFATVAQSELLVLRPDQSVVATPVPGAPNSSTTRYLLTSNGNGFALFWSDTAVRCVRFDHNGLVTGTTTVLSSPQQSMAVAASGNEFLLVTDGLSGLKISNEGVPIGTTFGIAAARGHTPSVAWTGSSWIVIWREQDLYGMPTEMYATSVSPQGAIGDHTLVTELGGKATVAGGATGGAMLVFPMTLEDGIVGEVDRLVARSIDAHLERTPRRHPVRRP